MNFVMSGKKRLDHQQDSNLRSQCADFLSGTPNEQISCLPSRRETDFLSVTEPLGYGVMGVVERGYAMNNKTRVFKHLISSIPAVNWSIYLREKQLPMFSLH